MRIFFIAPEVLPSRSECAESAYGMHMKTFIEQNRREALAEKVLLSVVKNLRFCVNFPWGGGWRRDTLLWAARSPPIDAAGAEGTRWHHGSSDPPKPHWKPKIFSLKILGFAKT